VPGLLDPERSQMFWIVLVHYLRKALLIVTIARVSTMEDDAARVRVYPCYQCQNLYETSTMFNTFKLRWFPLFAVFTPLNVWTDEGQPCDYSASCSILPAFRMCTHHYTTVGIPIFRHLIQKSIVCWDVPSGNGLRTGKKMRASSQRCRKFTAAARMPSTARLTSFESRGVRTWPGI